MSTDRKQLRRKPRLTAVSVLDQIVIDSFLEHFKEALEHTLNEHRVVYMETRNQILLNQITYFKNQLATVKWMIAVNLQRKTYVKASPTGGAGIQRGLVHDTHD